MLLITTDHLPEKELEVLGMVQGSALQNIPLPTANPSSVPLSNEEMSLHLDALNTTRSFATEKMIESATKLDADAIINLRYSSHSVCTGLFEVLVYGTAVKYKMRNHLQQF